MEEVEEAKTFREIVTDTFRIGGASNIGEFLPFLRKIGFKGVEKELQELQRKRDTFMQSLIEQHRKETRSEEDPNSEGGKNKTLIQVLLSLQETEPDYYKDVTIRSFMLVSSSVHGLLSTSVKSRPIGVPSPLLVPTERSKSISVL